MKTIITCRRVCMYDVLQDKVIAILAECFNPALSNNDILSVVYNPQTMTWVSLPLHEELWFKNSNIRVEVISEYAEQEQWFDKIKKWLSN